MMPSFSLLLSPSNVRESSVLFQITALLFGDSVSTRSGFSRPEYVAKLIKAFNLNKCVDQVLKYVLVVDASLAYCRAGSEASNRAAWGGI